MDNYGYLLIIMDLLCFPMGFSYVFPFSYGKSPFWQVPKFPKDEMFAQLAEGESSDSTAWEPIQSMVSVTPPRFDGKPITREAEGTTLWLCQNSYGKWPSRNSGFTH